MQSKYVPRARAVPPTCLVCLENAHRKCKFSENLQNFDIFQNEFDMLGIKILLGDLRGSPNKCPEQEQYRQHVYFVLKMHIESANLVKIYQKLDIFQNEFDMLGIKILLGDLRGSPTKCPEQEQYLQHVWFVLKMHIESANLVKIYQKLDIFQNEFDMLAIKILLGDLRGSPTKCPEQEQYLQHVYFVLKMHIESANLVKIY